MVKRLSDLNKSIEYVPVPQSPDRAGMQKDWMGTLANIPSNWFVCDGQAVSRTVYPNLFLACGEKYGAGDGSTTFNIPNGPWHSFDVDLDIQNLVDSFNLEYAKGVVHSTAKGNYYLDFWIRIGSGFITNDTTTFHINGISLFNPATRTEQSFNASSSTTQPLFRNVAYADTGLPTTNTFEVGGEGTHNTLTMSGKVRLASAPTDSFVLNDARYATMADAWQAIPIIKAYDDDDARVAISTVP